MTTIPFKLHALRRITDTLKTITPANGYEHDLSDFNDAGLTRTRVFRGRSWFGDTDPIPMLSLLEGTNPADDVSEPPRHQQTGEYDWLLLVQGFVRDDPVNPTDPAYLLMTDVKRRLSVESVVNNRGDAPLFGLSPSGKNRLTSFRIGPGVVRPADDVSANAYFWLSLVVRIVDNAAKPYDY